MKNSTVLYLTALLVGGPAAAQVEQLDPVPIFRVTVVSRTTKAINYRHRGGATKIDFRGTPLLPEARGEAKVESKQGYIEIEVEFDDLEPATKFGPEYLTYVMWAITPEGRSTNLGEVLLNGNESKLNVTTELQAFGLIVTAEPHFAVTQPSDVVVMENIVRKDTVGKIEEVDAKYELLQRGHYTMRVAEAEVRSLTLDRKTPLELYEARNAVRIARWAGAERYAADTFQRAQQLLQQAEDSHAQKKGKRQVAMAAREAAQRAEDARLITVKRQEEERLANERREAAEREARARAAAEAEAQKRALAEAEQRLEIERRTRAEADRAAAERSRLEAERARQESDAAAQRAAQERAEAEAARAAAQAQQQALQAEAEAARAAAQAQQQALQAEAERARAAADQAERLRQQAENEKAELRSRLVQQLNVILETRDTARGLIVNMSDVLFDTGKYNLRPAAREKLAKISGIVLAHPGLKLEVEGHTDSVGSDEYNRQLSERRAAAVRDYLVQQRLPESVITARGYGESRPVVTNDTAAGRQRNRRVELVVHGEPIGTPEPSARVR